MKKRLLGLMDGLPCAIRGENAVVTGIAIDSRRVRPGALFFALPGAKNDGRAFIAAALKRGAAAVCAPAGTALPAAAGATLVTVPDVRGTLARVADRFWGHPSGRLGLIGVTGTNGKTTTAFYTKHILTMAGRPTGLLGTVRNEIGGRVLPASLTTPESHDLNAFLHRMVRAGMVNAVAEISSQGIDAGRADGLTFAQCLFTNLSGEHLDHHGTMEAYFAAKARLFAMLPAGHPAVINLDDPWGRRLAAQVPRAAGVSLRRHEAYLTGRVRELTADGTRLELRFGGRTRIVHLNRPGRHNAMNFMMAAAAALQAGVDLAAVARAGAVLPVVPGRLEAVDCGQEFAVYVDYAHTDQALENVLTAVRGFTRRRVIAVFGAGGDRDRTKRPRMGRVACDRADLTVLTSDNPRGEDPRRILRDIQAGTGGREWKVIADRHDAIAVALDAARPGDTVVIAGKGHEDYQIIGTERTHFSDAETVRDLLCGKVCS
ncbi:MAG: UDP-N-acetylmuramoyl-L-alanyl-D-glutamate--2,6-diaminopimelate ligase [Planctomycetota bacterium]